jgi:predicted nuclease of restriction endonuclease-like (RecB) superfamily
MMQFSTQFDRNQIVSLITTKLSWSHIVELLPLGTDAKSYYIEQVNKNYLTCSKLRDMISRKAFERREIANAQLAEKSLVPFNIFKDPYLLDTLGLKDNFLEADLENAILQELGKFILEFGHGFTFIERQKRVTIGDKDFHIDLLFYHRDWQRLVVIELKRDEFKAAYKGQMELYLKWLDKNERKDGENAPIGIILCPRADKNVVELLELDKSGIAVAEFWTKLPPKKEFETKINQLLAEAKERVERRKQIGKPTTKKQIDFFYDTNDEEDHAD